MLDVSCSSEDATKEPILRERLVVNLRPVRRRRHIWAILRGSARGIFLGAVAGLAFGFWHRSAAEPAGWLVVAAPVIGLVVGAGWAWVHPPAWKSVAAAVDASHRLKDRALTAWQFAQREHPSDLHRLQILEALDHLQGIDVRRAAPGILPRSLLWSVVLWALAAGLLWVPSGTDRVQARSERPDKQIARLAEQLRQTMLKELQQLTTQLADDSPEQQELQTLVDQLSRQIEVLQIPGVDRADALAQLSEMQAALASLDSHLQLKTLQHDLQRLGKVLEASAALQSLGQALQDQQFQAASEQFEAVQPQEILQQEAQTLAERLQPLAKQLQTEGQQELGTATQQLGEALRDQDESATVDAVSQLASLAQQLALRLTLAGQVSSQANRLSEAKAFALSGGKNSSRSQQPRQTWGRGTAGDPLVGEATSLASQRERQEVPGMVGEGPSRRELIRSDEGRPEQAVRPYRDVYPEFRQQAEDVLLHEPLPLGHRQLIRQYFEAIRPSSEDVGS